MRLPASASAAVLAQMFREFVGANLRRHKIKRLAPPLPLLLGETRLLLQFAQPFVDYRRTGRKRRAAEHSVSQSVKHDYNLSVQGNGILNLKISHQPTGSSFHASCTPADQRKEQRSLRIVPFQSFVERFLLRFRDYRQSSLSGLRAREPASSPDTHHQVFSTAVRMVSCRTTARSVA